ncbi:HIT domain-containing protein [Wolbachia endosymbiont of Howardula sp.]|uniref:HIT domain-containing protein n=1 Tax=Wolbachia endosymbiont of Howardula sp. TaxID=2916816 RepID=UPI00217EC0B0|nr:HIT domain-containing protein [Wolbachia endosymbiont of Howardula sp.]UWI83310.1 HIT domain-containing protein [Wolbachia endosymbiont of Howardula sp.]
MNNILYDTSNIFFQILKGNLPCRNIYEDEFVLGFYDKYPDAPIHILAIPKNQYISYDDFIVKAESVEIINFFKAVRIITRAFNLDKTGYRLVTNHGHHGEQVVPHFHIHILGGKKLGKHVNI